MGLILKVSAGGVPAGSYLAKFTGIEATNNDYGDGLRWQFEVLNGENKGLQTSRTTSNKPTLKNSAGKLLAGLAGGALTPGMEIDPIKFVSQTYLIVVANTESGSTRVESVTAPPVA
jgi:hypothetical protein